jgi:hypothetical protein
VVGLLDDILTWSQAHVIDISAARQRYDHCDIALWDHYGSSRRAPPMRGADPGTASDIAVTYPAVGGT